MNSLVKKFAGNLARLVPFAKRADDPLTHLKAATRWVESLPIGDAFKCQQAVAEALKRFNEDPAQLTRERLSVLMLLDEKSRDLQDTLVRQYLRNPRMSRSVESQLWHAVYGLYWEIARGYHTFVLHFVSEGGKSQHDSLLPLITLRAIRTFGLLLKWRAVRYLPASQKCWQRLHYLYRVAENGGFQRQAQQAYADEAPDCSCETAYLHILMLNLANSGTLYPRQLDLLDSWLRNWHDLLQLDTRLDISVHNFVVDLSSDHGPRRVRKPDADKPMRFWSTASLLLKLQDSQKALGAGRSPAELGLTEFIRTAESLELLDHLLQQWAPLASREQRRAPREAIKSLVDVAHGLGAIVGQVKARELPAEASPYGSGLNYSEVDDVQVFGFVRERPSQMPAHVSLAPSDVERWVMHDKSDCGYGALVEFRDKDWLRVGTLLGIKTHDQAEWKLGIVRRLSRHDDSTSSVGIETLAETPTLVMLYDTATSGYTVNGFDNSGAGLPHAGLWLGGHDGADSVLIDPIHFAPGKIFEVRGVAGREAIALGNPIERSEGWIRVSVVPING
jgi:hypothetical protein